MRRVSLRRFLACWLDQHHQLYSGTGADIVMESITLRTLMSAITCRHQNLRILDCRYTFPNRNRFGEGQRFVTGGTKMKSHFVLLLTAVVAIADSMALGQSPTCAPST